MTLHDPNLHLFVDDRGLYQVYRTRRVLGQLRRLPGPVLAPDRPWEQGNLLQMWGSVIYEPERDLFRAWYLNWNVTKSVSQARVHGIAYAESRDGIHWEKPELGVVEQAGTRSHNICLTAETIHAGLGFDGGAVVIDPADPDPDGRYKFVAWMGDSRMWASAEARTRYGVVSGHWILRSPDGLRWDRRPQETVTSPAGDVWDVPGRRLQSGYRDAFRLTWDERAREWMLTVGSRVDPIDPPPLSLGHRAYGLGGAVAGQYFTGVRHAGLRRGPSLDQFGPVDPILVLDEDDGYGLFGQFHFPGLLFNYGDQYLGLLDYISDHGVRVAQYLLSSRDGRSWERVFREDAFLGGGPLGTWDEDLPYLIKPSREPRRNWPWAWDHKVGFNAPHNAPILKGDDLYFFYSARRREHGLVWHRLHTTSAAEANVNDLMSESLFGTIGLATLPRDRFVGLRSVAGEYGGDRAFVVTAPVEVGGPNLYLNLGLDSPNGWARVEVRDASVGSGRLDALPGLGLEECEPLARDGVRLKVGWRDGAGVAELRGRKVALRIAFGDATLYSYSFGE